MTRIPRRVLALNGANGFSCVSVLFVESALSVVLFWLLVVPAQAGSRQLDQPRRARWPAPNTLARAGQPQQVRRLARPTYTREYNGGWVGGGAGFRGDPPRANEGVWGRDYVGLIYPRRVWPKWFHGRREQEGVGKYSSDGPHLIKR
jgi:hypothetical protein